MPDLVLASTSPYRRALLARLGVPFRCVAPRRRRGGVEGPDRSRPASWPNAWPGRRPRASRRTEPDAVIIGGDQLVAFEGRVFGKPGDAGAGRRAARDDGRADARADHGGRGLASRGRRRAHRRDDPLDAAARARARSNATSRPTGPFDCAGGYKLEERGIALFERIESADHTAITGLPLIALTTILRGLGVRDPVNALDVPSTREGDRRMTIDPQRGRARSSVEILRANERPRPEAGPPEAQADGRERVRVLPRVVRALRPATGRSSGRATRARALWSAATSTSKTSAPTATTRASSSSTSTTSTRRSSAPAPSTRSVARPASCSPPNCGGCPRCRRTGWCIAYLDEYRSAVTTPIHAAAARRRGPEAVARADLGDPGQDGARDPGRAARPEHRAAQERDAADRPEQAETSRRRAERGPRRGARGGRGVRQAEGPARVLPTHRRDRPGRRDRQPGREALPRAGGRGRLGRDQPAARHQGGAAVGLAPCAGIRPPRRRRERGRARGPRPATSRRGRRRGSTCSRSAATDSGSAR